MLLCVPFGTIALRLCVFVFKFVERLVVFLLSFIRSVDDQVYYDVSELPAHFHQVLLQDYEIVVVHNRTQAQAGVICWIDQSEDVFFDSCPTKVIINDHDNSVLDSWLYQYLYSDHFCMSKYNTDTNTDVGTDIDIDIGNGSDESMIDQDSVQETEDLPVSTTEDHSYAFDDHPMIIRAIEDDETDQFHQKYTSRMRFFNLLYHERLHGMKVMSNEHLTMIGTDFVVWDRMDRKRIIRSLEYDLEMICVAQSCLLWEALHHQYQKVEAVAFSENDHNNFGNYVLFEHSVGRKYQELQIQMDRFVEDQKCCNDILKRLSFQAILQVPDATGLIFREEEINKMMMMHGHGTRASQVLEAINKCIQAFWLYIQTDEKKSSLSWLYNAIWRNNPTVEDPHDLELLDVVTKTLYKKGIMLKDVQGKSKCWLRKKVKPLLTEEEKKNLVFAMIDMKLVQRLLKMCLLSSSHLNWCQDKLNNLDFKQGKVFRGCNSLLFPSS